MSSVENSTQSAHNCLNFWLKLYMDWISYTQPVVTYWSYEDNLHEMPNPVFWEK